MQTETNASGRHSADCSKGHRRISIDHKLTGQSNASPEVEPGSEVDHAGQRKIQMVNTGLGAETSDVMLRTVWKRRPSLILAFWENSPLIRGKRTARSKTFCAELKAPELPSYTEHSCIIFLTTSQ